MRRTRMVWLALAVVGLAMLLAPGTSEAGRPVYKDASEETSDLNHAKVVDDPEAVYDYYADLAPGKPDIYEVYARQGQAMNPRLLVPKKDELKDFAPTLAIIGPGITSTLTADQMAALPVKPPTSTGVLIARPGAPQSRETVTDPVLFASYWKSQDARQTYPQDGPYYVVVWDEQGRGGKYVLSIGGQEEFGLFDLIKYPYTWTKQELWHGNWLAVLVALAVLALIVFGIVWLVRGSRRKA